MFSTIPVILILVLVFVVIVISRIRIVQQAKAYVIERLGAYKTTWGVGIHFLVPFIERVAKVVSLKEQVADFPPQPVITKDNVTMQIDTVVYFQVTDPKLYTYGIEQPMIAIENLSATTLRNIIGELELDECLTSRDVINTKMRAILDEATVRKVRSSLLFWKRKVKRKLQFSVRMPKSSSRFWRLKVRRRPFLLFSGQLRKELN